MTPADPPGTVTEPVVDEPAGGAAVGSRPDAAERFRPSHLVRHVPAFVWLVTVLHVLVMVVNVGFWAPNRGPDEFRHVGLIAGVATGAAVPWPDPGTFSTTQGVSAGLLDPKLAQGKTLYSAARAPATRGDWPSYVERGGDAAGARPNQLVQHPPTFYYLMGAALHLLPDWPHRPYVDVYAFLRLLDVLLLAPLTLLLYAGARRLLGPGPAANASAALVLVIPQVARNGASVENDNLLVALLAALSVLTVYVIAGDTSRRTALGIGVLGALALLTKGLALFLPLYLFVVYAYAWWRFGRRAVLPGIVALAVAGLGSGWWWLRNMASFGVIQPEGTQIVQNGLGPPRTTWAQTGPDFLEGFVRRTNFRFWLDAHIWDPPQWVEYFDGILLVALLVGLAVGLATARRWPDLGHLRALVVLVPVVCQLGIILVGAWHSWQSTLFPAGQQGRYLYGGLVGLTVVACAGFARVLGRRAGLLPLLVLLAGLFVTLVQFALGFRIYYTPRHHTSYLNDLVEGSRNLLAWSPLTPVWFWLAVAGTVAAALAGIVGGARLARSRTPAVLPRGA
jgi:4-amino-4-deoxy-L-arabinose transferase-like glycosyltransferase